MGALITSLTTLSECEHSREALVRSCDSEGALMKGPWRSKALYDARWQFKQISLRAALMILFQLREIYKA